MIEAATVAVLLLVIVIIATGAAQLKTRTPYGGTNADIVRLMLRAAELKEGERVFDIGAGDGRLLIAAKRQMPEITAIGYENALGIWLWGQLRILFSGVRVSLRFRDALRKNFSDADAIFLYMGPEMMEKLEIKLKKELRPGARVVSHLFRLPHTKASQEHPIPGKPGKYIYAYRF